MRSILSLIVIALVVMGLYILLKPAEEKSPITRPITSTTMEIKSPAFSSGGAIPVMYTCDGENVSPPLSVSNIPEGATSLALIMDDPDVPKEVRDSGEFTHWVLYNMEPTTTELPQDARGFGSEGKNGSGNVGYTGPCPPIQYEPTEHRYFFRVYALDIELSFENTPSKEDVLQAIEGHVLAQGELMGRYDRSEK